MLPGRICNSACLWLADDGEYWSLIGDGPAAWACIRPVPGIPGSSQWANQRVRGWVSRWRTEQSSASIIDNNIGRIMQCQIRELGLPSDQSQRCIPRPDQWEPASSRSLQLHLTPVYDGEAWSDVNKWKTPGSVWPWIFNALESGASFGVCHTWLGCGELDCRVIKKYKLRQYFELQKPKAKAGNPRPGISKQNSISPSLQNICDIESYFALLSLVSSCNLGLWLADLGTSVVLAGDRLFI